jgi:DNA-binding PadR family transcriptional regulator
MNNNGFMLLSVIAELEPVSGYKLNQVIEQRGFRQWADIGSTSIYVNLKKLANVGLIEGFVAEEKHTKGPSAVLYRCTNAGKSMLRKLILDSLRTAREHDRRFDLALSAIHLPQKSEVLDALRDRMRLLKSEQRRIEDIRLRQGDEVSFQGRLLFERTLVFLDNEQHYTDRLIHQMEKEWK